MISKSYPYLSIAKKYDVDYGRVLAIADYLTHGRGLAPALGEIPQSLRYAIEDAVYYFDDIRRGRTPFPTT